VHARFFTFVQMELPWELGPADGRYLLRRGEGPEAGEPQHVVVLSTVGAERRGLLGGRSRTRRTDAEPALVPVARATIVDAVPLSADRQARTWLKQLDPEREAQAAAGVLNRVLWAHRIAAAVPHLHEVSPTQALAIRAGFGEGEQVAEGLWTDAREIVLSRRRAGRRATVLRPQERLAVLLAGRGQALLCEELVLRARLDLDAGRLELAAIELDRAYTAALGELPAEERGDMRERIDELRELRAEVAASARAALPDAGRPGPRAQTDTPTEPLPDADPHAEPPFREDSPASTGPLPHAEPEEQVVRHGLERLEAALRARTAAGFTVR
jgi:hypothetical protein